jgi:hypothetical protein
MNRIVEESVESDRNQIMKNKNRLWLWLWLLLSLLCLVVLYSLDLVYLFIEITEQRIVSLCFIMPPIAIATIQALCRANLGILQQKLQLMHVIKTRFGKDQATTLYREVCPIVQASIGQHVRHSMDHLESAARVAAAAAAENEDDHKQEIHYDLRKRGGDDEDDLFAAEKRIQNVVNVLESLDRQAVSFNCSRPVPAYFMLSSDPTEFNLPSTIGREMGFAAHHALHHMALIKIIATHTIGLAPDELPSNFGRAPSTVVHDRSISD